MYCQKLWNGMPRKSIKKENSLFPVPTSLISGVIYDSNDTKSIKIINGGWLRGFGYVTLSGLRTQGLLHHI